MWAANGGPPFDGAFFLERLGGAVAAVSAPILMATHVPDSASDAMSIPKAVVVAGAHVHKKPVRQPTPILTSRTRPTHT